MRGKRGIGRRVWLIPPALILALAAAGGLWYCLPYIEGDAEYARLREVAYGEASETQRATDGAAEGSTASDDPNMLRQIDWEALRAINPDVIGWIYVPDTPIDYPVVQDPESDPGKYLRTTFEGRVSWPNNEGTIYLDCGCAEKGFFSEAPLLYGHYQLNGSMFSAFSGNYDLATLESHDQVYVYTPDGAIHVELFAARIANASVEKVRTGFADRADLNAWLDGKLADAQAVSYDPGEVDQLWTFVTCSYTTWSNQRTLTYGRVVEDTRPLEALMDAVYDSHP